eukprot:scaffold3171_cov380-Prasinococcus_capsulatus_cf.AAC.4
MNKLRGLSRCWRRSLAGGTYVDLLKDGTVVGVVAPCIAAPATWGICGIVPNGLAVGLRGVTGAACAAGLKVLAAGWAPKSPVPCCCCGCRPKLVPVVDPNNPPGDDCGVKGNAGEAVAVCGFAPNVLPKALGCAGAPKRLPPGVAGVVALAPNKPVEPPNAGVGVAPNAGVLVVPKAGVD